MKCFSCGKEVEKGKCVLVDCFGKEFYFCPACSILPMLAVGITPAIIKAGEEELKKCRKK